LGFPEARKSIKNSRPAENINIHNLSTDSDQTSSTYHQIMLVTSRDDEITRPQMSTCFNVPIGCSPRLWHFRTVSEVDTDN
jgi:hypothetical protein